MSNVTRYVRNPDSRLAGEVVSGGRRNWVLVDKKIQPDRITGGGDDLPRSATGPRRTRVSDGPPIVV